MQAEAHSEADVIASCSPEQAQIWLQGLLSVAWSDGDYSSQEQALIAGLLPSPEDTGEELGPIAPAELGQKLEARHAENFLRTAVMTALADGAYTEDEDYLLREFCLALKLDLPQLALLQTTLVTPIRPNASSEPEKYQDPLNPLRDWLDGIQVHNRSIAHFLCRAIPAQCPFERDVVVMGRKVMHIPAMCKLNPLYEQVVGLRFRALSYLADDCGEDVTTYVQGSAESLIQLGSG